MDKILGQDELEIGKGYIKEKNYKEAVHYLRKAFLLYQDNPNQIPGAILSYYGVAIAYGEKNFTEGIVFCKKALNRKDLAPEFYLHAAELLIRNRQKKDAFKVLEEGLGKFKGHPKIKAKLEEFGVRKRPPIPVLKRSHPVNKVLGKIMRESITSKK